MNPVIKLLGAISFLIASGSAIALERNPFSLITAGEPAGWMLLCAFLTLASIARRRHILTQMNLWPANLAIPQPGPNGTVPNHT